MTDESSLLSRVAALERRVAELDSRTIGNVRFGPIQQSEDEIRADAKAMTERVLAAMPKREVPPVDRSAQQLTDGAPVPADRSHVELKENGQQKGYIVLSPEERAKGWVRPYRDSYVQRRRWWQRDRSERHVEAWSEAAGLRRAHEDGTLHCRDVRARSLFLRRHVLRRLRRALPARSIQVGRYRRAGRLMNPHTKFRSGYYDDEGRWQRTKYCFMYCGERCDCGPPFGQRYSVAHDKRVSTKPDDASRTPTQPSQLADRGEKL